MNCEDFESNVNDLAREQMMEASVRARALAHRDECEVCARRLKDESSLTFKLQALAIAANDEKVPSLGHELVTALRSNRVARTATRPTSRWRYRAAAGAAVAAMLLIVIAVAVMRSRQPASPRAQSPASTPGVRPGEALAPGVVLDSKPAPVPHDNTAGNRRLRGKRRNLNRPSLDNQLATRPDKEIAPRETAASENANSATEITTDFMPVGYASATSMQEGGQLLRVELPRSALIAFGLPMNVNRYDEKVKADVFFGADGMARAIRFVQ